MALRQVQYTTGSRGLFDQQLRDAVLQSFDLGFAAPSWVRSAAPLLTRSAASASTSSSARSVSNPSAMASSLASRSSYILCMYGRIWPRVQNLSDHAVDGLCVELGYPSHVPEPVVVSVPRDQLDDLQPVWRALYEHHTELSPHLREREVPFEQAWESRRQIEGRWLAAEPESFVLAVQDTGFAQDAGAGPVQDAGAARDTGRYVGYAFVRVRSGAGFAASWRASDPLAELAILVVLPEMRRQGIGSMLLDAVEARLRELGIGDMLIGVITTNTDAMRLYERRGAVPFLTEFIHRVQPASETTTASGP
jgi:GNAT superfamily N-acetyltransferase